MGVHPVCPVSLIIATKVAFVCGLWSARVVAILSARPLSYFCVHQLLFSQLEVLVQSASPHHAVGYKVLPGLGVAVECFHVFLADILVAQLRAAFGAPPRCQFSVKNVFWDVAILHAVDMTQATQPALSEQGEHTWKVGLGEDLSVGHSCLAGICLGYSGCFSDGRNWVFSLFQFQFQFQLKMAS